MPPHRFPHSRDTARLPCPSGTTLPRKAEEAFPNVPPHRTRRTRRRRRRPRRPAGPGRRRHPRTAGRGSGDSPRLPHRRPALRLCRGHRPAPGLLGRSLPADRRYDRDGARSGAAGSAVGRGRRGGPVRPAGERRYRSPVRRLDHHVRASASGRLHAADLRHRRRLPGPGRRPDRGPDRPQRHHDRRPCRLHHRRIPRRGAVECRDRGGRDDLRGPRRRPRRRRGGRDRRLHGRSRDPAGA